MNICVSKVSVSSLGNKGIAILHVPERFAMPSGQLACGAARRGATRRLTASAVCDECLIRIGSANCGVVGASGE